jgi:hypothetical protein
MPSLMETLDFDHYRALESVCNAATRMWKYPLLPDCIDHTVGTIVLQIPFCPPGSILSSCRLSKQQRSREAIPGCLWPLHNW